MTVDEILLQAKALTPQEREELIERLLSLPTPSQPEQSAEQDVHWGKSLVALLDEVSPIEMKYPEIEDPVEWVKHLRAEQRRIHLGDLADADTWDASE